MSSECMFHDLQHNPIAFLSNHYCDELYYMLDCNPIASRLGEFYIGEEKLIEKIKKSIKDKDPYCFYEMLHISLNLLIKHICKIYCFSEINNSTLMWSHYANNHKGVCVEYEVNQDSHHRKIYLQQNRFLMPINYSSEIPKISGTYFFHNIEENIEKILLSKSLDWSYEKEWRFIDFQSEYLIKSPFKITSIIFGERCENENINKIKDICGDHNIQYKQIKKHGSLFRLIVLD